MGNLQHKVRIIQKDWLTHNIFPFKLERPKGFEFIPGQAIELTIDKKPFLSDAAPFTLTGLSLAPYLEFIIKVYSQHNGMTLGLSKLNEGDYLLIGDAWDSFSYIRTRDVHCRRHRYHTFRCHIEGFGDKAEEAKWRAEKMAEMFQMKINYYKDKQAKPLL